MTVKYRISENDYVKASELFAKLTRKQVILLSSILLIALAFIFFGTGAIRAAAIGGTVSGVAVMVVIKYLINPYLMRQHYKKYKAMHDEFEIEILNDGLNFISSGGAGKVVWNSIYAWRHDERFILIYPMPRLFYVVPKSLAANGFDVDLVVQKLTQEVGNPI